MTIFTVVAPTRPGPAGTAARAGEGHPGAPLLDRCCDSENPGPQPSTFILLSGAMAADQPTAAWWGRAGLHARRPNPGLVALCSAHLPRPPDIAPPCRWGPELPDGQQGRVHPCSTTEASLTTPQSPCPNRRRRPCSLWHPPFSGGYTIGLVRSSLSRRRAASDCLHFRVGEDASGVCGPQDSRPVIQVVAQGTA
jgi:hypothetical protein